MSKLSKKQKNKRQRNNDTYGSGFGGGTQDDFDADLGGEDVNM